MTEFRIGDKVVWESHAGGSATTKTGVIYDVIRNTRHLWKARDTLQKMGTHQLMFDGNTMLAPVMYLVEVKGGTKARPKMYLPRPEQLKMVEAE
jgi:hypothetical protein